MRSLYVVYCYVALLLVCCSTLRGVDAVAALPENVPSGPGIQESFITVNTNKVSIPFPDDLPDSITHVGLVYFGEFRLLHPKTHKEIESHEIFLHHLFLWNQTKGKQFFGGCSDERSTWGPHFEPGRVLSTWHRQDHITGSIALSKIQSGFRSVSPLLQMRVRYYLPEDYPEGYTEAHGLYVLRSADVPVNDNGRHSFPYSFENPLKAKQHQEGEVVYFVGHLHVGGISLDLEQNNQIVCKSRVTYTDHKCFIECPTKCENVWNSLDTILPCVGIGTRFNSATKFKMIGHYNATCHFEHVHAQGVMWWAEVNEHTPSSSALPMPMLEESGNSNQAADNSNNGDHNNKKNSKISENSENSENKENNKNSKNSKNKENNKNKNDENDLTIR